MGVRHDPVLLSAPPLNAANDNDCSLRVSAENCESVTSDHAQEAAPSGNAFLTIFCVATASLVIVGWIFVISLALFDGIHWALSFMR
jgi:hypothetical protein